MAEQRRKVGILLPSSNTTLERDFQLVAPAGIDISYHSDRMLQVDGNPDALSKMNEELETAAKYVGTAKVDVIAYGCTGGSFLNGIGWDQQLLRRITAASDGIPAVSTSSAMVEALKYFGIKKVSVATPYLDSLNERLQTFLDGNGFSVLSLVGRQLERNTDIGADLPATIVEFAKKNFQPEADGMFLSCTNWRSVEAVGQLETELGKPVITANQATIWATFRSLGIEQPLTGFGRLLESFGELAAA